MFVFYELMQFKHPMATRRHDSNDSNSVNYQFIVGDETTMVDNVCGPALGFMARAVEMHNNDLTGLYTSADLMPKTSAEALRLKANELGREDLLSL